MTTSAEGSADMAIKWRYVRVKEAKSMRRKLAWSALAQREPDAVPQRFLWGASVSGNALFFQLSEPQNMTKNSGIATIENDHAIW
jgi:hypothetical protein